MGLLSYFRRLHQRCRLAVPHSAGPRAKKSARRATVEQMEKRQLLAGDIHFGGVYFEEATGDDSAGDRFEITFVGGQPGTQMTRVVIDTDKDGLGLSSGDLFFDTAAGGLGAFNAVGLVIGPTAGFTVTGVSVTDGGTLLAFDLSGFEAGEKLVFTIDVDEAQFVDPQTGDVDVNSLVEGGEFQRSKLTATFTAPHFFAAQGTALFFDAFDDNFADLEAANGTQLQLPPDNYIPPDTVDRTDRTAGAAELLNQQPLPITLAGTVFHDVNLNNVQDAGELGLAGVTLDLMSFNGTEYVFAGQSVVTDAAGNYLFEGLAPGTYAVAETQPPSFFSVGATAGSVNGVTRGVVESADRIRDIALLGGEDSVDNDFAEAREAELHGHVYIDANDNGLLDAGETGIAGATVIVEYLSPDGGAPQTIELLTDFEGRWWATGLRPGDYRVAEITPPGFIDGRDSAGTAGGTAHNPGDLITGIFLAGGQVGLQYNFGELLPSSIQGRVHADANGDCVFDPGETPLGGVEIWLLDGDGNVIDATITAADGTYRFDGLAPGTYGVFEVQPGAYFDGAERVGSAGGVISADDTITEILLGPGIDAVDYDFCEHEPVSISGFVYVDLNNNGRRDAGETPIENVTLTLLDEAGNSTGQATTTDAAGFYQFDELAPGVYGIRETHPDGFIDGRDVAGSAGGVAFNPGDLILGAALNPGVHGVNYNFGELLPSSIGGRVHADADGDCVFDPGETPLGGIEIWLLDADGNVIDTTTTDAAGNYRFDGLAPGTYGVHEVQPGAYFDGDEHVGSAGGVISADDTITEIIIGPGIDAVDYDFCEHEPVSISGFVYVDINNNGLRDGGETPIENVTLTLLDSEGNPTGQITTTDAAGFYQFDGLAPGVYGIREAQPEGFIDGLDVAGSAGGVAFNPGDLILGAALNPGVHGVNYNFGELLPSSIEGRVHADANGDCVFDPGETPLAGVEIWLLDGDGNVIDTTTTDAAGNYRFDGLAPGTYGIFEVQPGAYFDGAERVGSAGGVISANDTITEIIIGPGIRAVDYDFCEHEPVSISGFVYVDDNNNGIRQAGEAPIAGVTLTLLDADGNATGQSTVTDAAGFYQFDGLVPGVYGVAEAQPAGFFDGLDTAGSAGGQASNPGDMILGALLTPGVHGVNYNFGELRPGSLAGRIHADSDGDCIVDPGEVLLSGVTVLLLDADGNLLETTTTDADGNYRFDNLAPGTYRIREIQPDGYFDGDERVGTAGGRLGGNDLIIDIMLGSGVVGTGYDFCEIAPSSISGFVFQDGPVIVVNPGELSALDVGQLRDGRRTPDDRPLAGIELRLADEFGLSILDSHGRPITTVTDAFGYYEFTGLRAGIYSVFEAQPEGLIDGIDTAGTAGGLAINPSDVPIAVALAVPHNNDAIVDIRLTAGMDSLENNFSEVIVEILAPPPPVPPPVPPPPAPPVFPVFPPEFVAPEPFTPAAFAARPDVPAQLPLLIVERINRSSDRFVTRVSGYTWHLSVIDAGLPRMYQRGTVNAARLIRTHYDINNWHDPRVDMHASRWLVAAEDGASVHETWFGMSGGVPVPGDFNGDGIAEVAVFRDGQWYVDLNGNGIWDDGDLWARLGTRDDLPVAGDWDGDGKTDIGIFGPAWAGDPGAVAAEPGLPDPHNEGSLAPKNLPPASHQAAHGWRTLKRTRTGRLRADLIDHVFHYGVAGERPVAGDFNGDGVDQIGIFRDGQWVLDADGTGTPTPADIRATFGRSGDLPVVGDFNGDGVDQIGVFRDGTWILDTDGNFILDPSDEVHHHGSPGDLPITADFNADGRDEIAVYRDGGAG